MNDLSGLLNLITAFQGFSLCILLLVKRVRGFLFLEIILLKYTLLHLLQFAEVFPGQDIIGFLYMFAALPMLEGSALFLYVRQNILKAPFRPRDLFWFLPTLLHLTASLIFSESQWMEYLQYPLASVWTAGMIALSVRLLIRIDRKTISGRFYLWMVSILFMLTALTLFQGLDFLFLILHSDAVSDLFSMLTSIFELVIIFIPAWVIYLIPDALRNASMKEKHYQNSRLSEKEIHSIYSRVESHILMKNVLTDPDLNLSGLAEICGIKAHRLSEVINRKTGLNFNSWLKQLRIERACRLLIESPELNIIEVAYESGFNSKSSFNTAFREIMNQTPSEFRKKDHPAG